MKFQTILNQGLFIKRYKRFLVKLRYKNRIITCHCPNPGSMMGLLNKGNKVYFSKSNNLKRKLPYTLEIITNNKTLVGINTMRTNTLAKELLMKKRIKKKFKYDEIYSEIKTSHKTRLDFALYKKKKIIGYVEVKNVTLSRSNNKKGNNTAEFPDSKTIRGSKHLKELIRLKRKGFICIMLYIIQRNDCKYFSIADDIDYEYSKNFIFAKNSGINMLAYNCLVTNKSINIKEKIKVKLQNDK